MKTVLLTGATGQLGRELSMLDWGPSLELFTPGRSELDLLSEPSVTATFERRDFAAVINVAAYNAVDQAENDIMAAYAINAGATMLLAAASGRRGLPFIQLSTDYVFSGNKSSPYLEDDQPDPIGVYGASKLAGEIAARSGNPRSVVLRTAWLFSVHRDNFVKTMRRLAKGRSEIAVVSDQVGCPTAAGDVAAAVQTILLSHLHDRSAPSGVYHFVNEGQASRCELAAATLAGVGCDVRPIPSSEYPTRARRPVDSRLSTLKIARDFGLKARPWRQALDEVLNELRELERRPATGSEV